MDHDSWSVKPSNSMSSSSSPNRLSQWTFGMGSSLYQMVLLAVRLVADTTKEMIFGEVLVGGLYIQPQSWCVGELDVFICNLLYFMNPGAHFLRDCLNGLLKDISRDCSLEVHLPGIITGMTLCLRRDDFTKFVRCPQKESIINNDWWPTCFIQISLMYLVMSTLLIHPFSLAVTRKPDGTLSFGSFFLLNITIMSPLALHDNNNVLPLLIVFPPILFNILFAIKLKYITV